MTLLNPTQSVIKVTKALQGHSKFSYINIPKSSIVGLSKNSDNCFPNYFAKNIISALKLSDSSIMKALSHTLVSDVEAGKHFKIGLNKNAEYYHSNIFEYFYMNNRDVYNTIIDFFIRDSKCLVVSFNDKKLVQKHMGFKTHVINVPYSNNYDKLDNV